MWCLYESPKEAISMKCVVCDMTIVSYSLNSISREDDFCSCECFEDYLVFLRGEEE